MFLPSLFLLHLPHSSSLYHLLLSSFSLLLSIVRFPVTLINNWKIFQFSFLFISTLYLEFFFLLYLFLILGTSSEHPSVFLFTFRSFFTLLTSSYSTNFQNFIWNHIKFLVFSFGFLLSFFSFTTMEKKPSFFSPLKRTRSKKYFVYLFLMLYNSIPIVPCLRVSTFII